MNLVLPTQGGNHDSFDVVLQNDIRRVNFFPANYHPLLRWVRINEQEPFRSKRFILLNKFVINPPRSPQRNDRLIRQQGRERVMQVQCILKRIDEVYQATGRTLRFRAKPERHPDFALSSALAAVEFDIAFAVRLD